MKKIILYVLCALMLLSLCACGSRYGIVTGTDVTPTPGASTTTDNKYDVNNGGGVKSNGTGTTVPNGTAQQPPGTTTPNSNAKQGTGAPESNGAGQQRPLVTPITP